MIRIFLLKVLFLGILFASNTIPKEDYSKLQKAQKQIDNKSYNLAINTLNDVLKSKNSLSKSYALQSLAMVYINRQNYKKAISSYEKIIALKSFETKDINQIKFSLSQLYLSEGLYAKSIKYSIELLNKNFPKTSVLNENLALAYYNNNQYAKSIKYINRVIKYKKNKESWYKMLYSSYVQTKNYSSAIKILKQLLKKDRTNEDYWMQLVSLYQRTNNYKKSLATLEFLYKKDIVNKSKNIMYLVNVFLQNKIYNKPAKLLENAIKKGIIKNSRKNFELLTSCYINAKNYKKLISKLNSSNYANTQKYKLILANIYYDKSDYKNTIKVLKNHNFTQNSKSQGQKYILLALSFYEQKDTKSATTYLKKASSNKFEAKRAVQIANSLRLKI